MRLGAAFIVLGFAAAARADSVRNEVFVSSTQATQANPRSAVFTDALNASFDLGTDWTVSGGTSLTLQGPTPAADQAGFGNRGGAIVLFNAGVDWSATENLTLGATFDVSPPSTQYVGVATSTLTAELRSRTSQVSFGLSGSWDTLGISDLEWSFDLGVDFSHYDIDQSIARVRGGTLSGRLGALSNVPLTLDFARLSPGITATLLQDTDVSLLADWYVYAQDPARIGFGGVALLGQGAGLPIAPLRFMVRPEILHRFGDLSAKLWLQAGEYAAGTGDTTAAIGVKLQYKFSKAFRAWVTASGQRDVDAEQRVTRSGTISLGGTYRW